MRLWADGRSRYPPKRVGKMDEATELYDLTTHQHGANALINHPEKLAKYLEKSGTGIILKNAAKHSLLDHRQQEAVPKGSRDLP